MLVQCPYCFGKAVICCGLCGGRKVVPKEAANQYRKLANPTVDDRIRIREQFKAKEGEG